MVNSGSRFIYSLFFFLSSNFHQPTMVFYLFGKKILTRIMVGFWVLVSLL